MTLDEFRELPLFKMGESKEIRQHPTDESRVVIWLRPTIYSFTHNRTAWVEGSNLLRARMMKRLLPVLQEGGVDHAYESIDEKTGLIIARKIRPSEDPNIEVIIKVYNLGTSWHRYYGMGEKPTRMDHPFWPGRVIGKGATFGGPRVRFDWRNPFWNPDKVAEFRAQNPELPSEVYRWPDDLRGRVMMRDEVLGEDFADYHIDVRAAKQTALRTYAILQQFLAVREIVLYDLCLFITSNGKTVFGEIDQDCGRFRHLDEGSLDKDVWRSGGSEGDVLQKWRLLADMVDQ